MSLDISKLQFPRAETVKPTSEKDHEGFTVFECISETDESYSFRKAAALKGDLSLKPFAFFSPIENVVISGIEAKKLRKKSAEIMYHENKILDKMRSNTLNKMRNLN